MLFRSRKVSDLLIDAGVPRADRDRVLLLCDDARVLWVAGLRQAAGTKPRGAGAIAAKITAKDHGRTLTRNLCGPIMVLRARR